MTTQDNATSQSMHPATLTTPMLIGAGLALLLILLFLSGVNNPDPAWGSMWKLKPIIMVPIAGAIGGGFYYCMGLLSFNSGLNKSVAVIVGLIGYVVVLWLGTVLGLNGTLWN